MTKSQQLCEQVSVVGWKDDDLVLGKDGIYMPLFVTLMEFPRNEISQIN